MLPNYKENDIVLYKKFDKTISRFDIVIIKKNNTSYIKRIIGLPNEKIEYKDNTLYINDKKTSEPFLTDKTLTEDCIFSDISDNMYVVLGDNRENSFDSRKFGYVKYNEIIGIIQHKF